MKTLEAHLAQEPFTQLTRSGGPAETLSLPKVWAHWILAEARRRQVNLRGVEWVERSGWCLCAPGELLPRVRREACSTDLTQRGSCNGLVTTVVFGGPAGRFGAWWVERRRNEAEDAVWRSILLEALVLSCREPLSQDWNAPMSEDGLCFDH